MTVKYKFSCFEGLIARVNITLTHICIYAQKNVHVNYRMYMSDDFIEKILIC